MRREIPALLASRVAAPGRSSRTENGRQLLLDGEERRGDLRQRHPGDRQRARSTPSGCSRMSTVWSSAAFAARHRWRRPYFPGPGPHGEDSRLRGDGLPSAPGDRGPLSRRTMITEWPDDALEAFRPTRGPMLRSPRSQPGRSALLCARARRRFTRAGSTRTPRLP